MNCGYLCEWMRGIQIVAPAHCQAAQPRDIFSVFPDRDRSDRVKIIYIDDGKIIAVGTHEELIKTCPSYEAMAELQRLEAEK